MKIPKNAENADLYATLDSTEFKEHEKFDQNFGNSIAVKFEQRFPAQPPLATEPSALAENPKWAARKKRLQDLTFIDWEWIRMTYWKNVQANEEKRIKEREEQVLAIAEEDARIFIEKQMNEQQLRIHMTWMEKFRAERKHRKIRLEEHLEFIENMREKRALSREMLRIEKFLVRRKKGLESPVPPPPVTYSRDLIKEELICRQELAQRRENLSEALMETLRQAQIMTSTVLFKQQLDLQSFQEEIREEKADNAYIVNRIKATKR